MLDQIQEYLDDLENVGGELPVRARRFWKQGLELVLGNSRKQALRARENGVGLPDEIRGSTQSGTIPADSRNARDVLQDLSIDPIVTASHDGNAAHADPREVLERFAIRQNVDGYERNAVLGQEFLGPKARAAAGLPIDLQRFIVSDGFVHIHSIYAKCKSTQLSYATPVVSAIQCG